MMRYALFSFRGRLGRLAYFGYGVLAVVLAGIMMAIGSFLLTTFGRNGQLQAEGFGVAGLGIVVVAILMLVINTLALAVKRLHDLDRSGHHLWWIYGIGIAESVMFNAGQTALGGLLTLISFGAGIWLWFARGTNGDNRFGPSPVPVRDARADYFVPPNQRTTP